MRSHRGLPKSSVRTHACRQLPSLMLRPSGVDARCRGRGLAALLVRLHNRHADSLPARYDFRCVLHRHELRTWLPGMIYSDLGFSTLRLWVPESEQKAPVMSRSIFRPVVVRSDGGTWRLYQVFFKGLTTMTPRRLSLRSSCCINNITIKLRQQTDFHWNDVTPTVCDSAPAKIPVRGETGHQNTPHGKMNFKRTPNPGSISHLGEYPPVIR